jgi:hypothetical protein
MAAGGGDSVHIMLLLGMFVTLAFVIVMVATPCNAAPSASPAAGRGAKRGAPAGKAAGEVQAAADAAAAELAAEEPVLIAVDADEVNASELLDGGAEESLGDVTVAGAAISTDGPSLDAMYDKSRGSSVHAFAGKSRSTDDNMDYVVSLAQRMRAGEKVADELEAALNARTVAASGAAAGARGDLTSGKGSMLANVQLGQEEQDELNAAFKRRMGDEVSPQQQEHARRLLELASSNPEHASRLLSAVGGMAAARPTGKDYMRVRDARRRAIFDTESRTMKQQMELEQRRVANRRNLAVGFEI